MTFHNLKTSKQWRVFSVVRDELHETVQNIDLLKLEILDLCCILFECL